ncbi:MAG: hypothetical protein WC998_05880 [Candidatus Paceibacterota bacterium]|jgi:hypothetical protein
MLTAELLSGLRTLLDEATEEFWTDEECYTALSNGQSEYISIILAQYKAKSLINPSEPIPEILKPLYTESVQSIVGATTLALPPTFLYDISVYLGAPYEKALLKRELSKSRRFEQANIYSSGNGEYYSIDGTNINLEIDNVPVSLSVTFDYLVKPTYIGALIEPILPDFTHNSVITYAYAELLKKTGNRFDEADRQFKLFLSLVKYI